MCVGLRAKCGITDKIYTSMLYLAKLTAVSLSCTNPYWPASTIVCILPALKML